MLGAITNKKVVSESWGGGACSPGRGPCRSDTGRRWCRCSTGRPWHRSSATWWPLGPWEGGKWGGKSCDLSAGRGHMTPPASNWCRGTKKDEKGASSKPMLTMYMGDPQSVAAIILFCRCRAKPKSAGERRIKPIKKDDQHRAHILQTAWTS